MEKTRPVIFCSGTEILIGFFHIFVNKKLFMCELNNIESWRNKSGKAFGGVIFKLKRDPESIKKLEALTPFLNEHYNKSKISIQQRFYHVWFGFLELEVCPFCGLPRMFSKIPKFSIDRYGEIPTNPVNYYKTCMEGVCRKKDNLEKTKNALIEKYGSTNPMGFPGVMEKIKETNREKYGENFFMASEEFKQKTKKTFLEKYGMHPTKLEKTQDKKKATNLERYGSEHALNNLEVKEKSKATNNLKYGGNSSMCSEEIKNKSKETNQKKHGVDWYVQSEDFKKKFTEKMLANYGVEHALHYTPSYEKSLETSYRKKIFVFPSGRAEKIQGYEGFALWELLDSNCPEEDIIVSNEDMETYTGKIWYFDSQKKSRKYYPDIFLKSENKIIEVKSKYTYETNISINKAKRKVCLDLGIAFEFWIYDAKGLKTVK